MVTSPCILLKWQTNTEVWIVALLMAKHYSASILMWDMVRSVFDGFPWLCCPCHNLNSQWENPPPGILLNAWWAGCRWLQMDVLVTFQVAWVTGYWHEGGPCCWAAIYANLVSNNSLADRRKCKQKQERPSFFLMFWESSFPLHPALFLHPTSFLHGLFWGLGATKGH